MPENPARPAARPGPVPRETLDGNLAELDRLLGEMAELVVVAFHKATTALLQGRGRLAQQVIAEDPALDALRARVSGLASDTIVRFAPVVGPLRAVVSAIRSAHELERMGDLARHIAKAAHRRDPQPLLPEPARPLFAELSTLVEAMARKTATVLRTHDVVLAAELERDDDEVDRLHRELFELMFGPQWTAGVAAAVDTTLVARFYERFADHAVAVATRTIYTVTGRRSLPTL